VGAGGITEGRAIQGVIGGEGQDDPNHVILGLLLESEVVKKRENGNTRVLHLKLNLHHQGKVKIRR